MARKRALVQIGRLDICLVEGDGLGEGADMGGTHEDCEEAGVGGVASIFVLLR